LERRRASEETTRVAVKLNFSLKFFRAAMLRANLLRRRKPRRDFPRATLHQNLQQTLERCFARYATLRDELIRSFQKLRGHRPSLRA
jgi:hypothetical protein